MLSERPDSEGSDLEGSDLEESDLEGSDLEEPDLEEPDLEGSDSERLDARTAEPESSGWETTSGLVSSEREPSEREPSGAAPCLCPLVSDGSWGSSASLVAEAEGSASSAASRRSGSGREVWEGNESLMASHSWRESPVQRVRNHDVPWFSVNTPYGRIAPAPGAFRSLQPAVLRRMRAGGRRKRGRVTPFQEGTSRRRTTESTRRGRRGRRKAERRL